MPTRPSSPLPAADRAADDRSAPVLSDAKRRLLEQTPNVIVATIGSGHQPQLTPNWFLWDGADFLVSTNESTFKVRNIQRDPRVTLCIDSPAGEALYAQVVGRAVVEPGEREQTLRLIAKYRDEEDVLEHWESIREGHVLLRITPLRWQWMDLTG